MPVTINGTTGITTPAIDAAAGNSALTTLSVAGNNISAANSFGFRNRIINGDMRIDQRNNGASVTQTTSVVYTVDRWSCYGSAASKFTVQRNAGSVTPPAGFTNYLGATSSSAYSVGASEFFFIQQVIEGLNSADFGWGAAGAASVTLSFWARSSLTGTFGGTLSNGATNRVYPFTYTISAANTWEQKSITVSGDTTGSWATDNTGGLVVNFNMGAGASVSGAAGAWSGSTLRAPTGATSVVGTNGATFYITGVQLEAGTVASPFERVDYGRQLIQCQRYYQPIFVDYGTLALCRTTSIATFAVKYLVEMRTTASYTFPTYPLGWAANDGANRTTSSLGTAGGSATTQGFVVNGSGLTSNQMMFNYSGAVAALASAEL